VAALSNLPPDVRLISECQVLRGLGHVANAAMQATQVASEVLGGEVGKPIAWLLTLEAGIVLDAGVRVRVRGGAARDQGRGRLEALHGGRRRAPRMTEVRVLHRRSLDLGTLGLLFLYNTRHIIALFGSALHDYGDVSLPTKLRDIAMICTNYD
jgi:hypothetical protein